MTREDVKKLLPFIEAFIKGKIIQYQKSNGKWIDIDKPCIKNMCDNLESYRIKPESKYRPFTNTKECWLEMLNHQPFGWLKGKDSDNHYVLLTYIDEKNISLNSNNGWSFVDIMNNYTFVDGSIFGIKEE